MNISSRCEYACRALVELANVAEGQSPMPAMVIAERRGIPEKFLVQILLELKKAGLVRSVRGAQGGYRLSKAPGEISVGDIVRAIDGPVLDPLPAESEGGSDLAPAWREIAQGIDTVLDGVSVGDLKDGAANTHMYYI